MLFAIVLLASIALLLIIQGVIAWNKAEGIEVKGGSELEIAENVAEVLREGEYHLLTNNCYTKSIKFCREMKRRGIRSNLVWVMVGMGEADLPLMGRRVVPLTLPYCTHFYGEVGGRRFEASRPIGEKGPMGIIPSEIIPIVKFSIPIQ